jgi:hypothetical protein
LSVERAPSDLILLALLIGAAAPGRELVDPARVH